MFSHWYRYPAEPAYLKKADETNLYAGSDWGISAQYVDNNNIVSKVFLVANVATLRDGVYYINASTLFNVVGKSAAPGTSTTAANTSNTTVVKKVEVAASPFALKYEQTARQQKQVKEELLLSGEIRFYHGSGHTDDKRDVKVYIYKPDNPGVPVYTITKKYDAYYDELSINKKNIIVKGSWGIQMERGGKKSKIYLIADIATFAGMFLTSSPEFPIEGE
jgi:hypothetical protein